MKKIVLSLVLFFSFFIFSWVVSASCQSIRFANWNEFCFNIEKQSGSYYKAYVESSNFSSSSLTCSLVLPNAQRVSLGKCAGSFSYNWNNGDITIRADLDDYYRTKLAYYDFNSGKFTNWSDSSSSSVDKWHWKYYVEITSTSTSNPKEWDWVDVTVAVRRNGSIAKNYTWKLDISVQRYSNSRWSTPSSSYYELSKDVYTFSSSDYGSVNLKKLVKFKEWWEYRLVFSLRDWANTVYQSFDISTSSSSKSYEPEITWVSDSYPDEWEWVDVTVAVRNNWSRSNYTWKVSFSVQKYKNSRWTSASSSDYSLDRTSYTFTSSDDWEVTFRDFVRFRNSWEYRLVVELSSNWKSDYEEFDVDYYGRYDDDYYYNDRYYSADSLSIYSVSPSSPSVGEWVDVSVRVYDRYNSIVKDYTWKINFEVQIYKNGSWKSASSSYYTLDRNYYTFSRSDNWKKTFSSLIKFKEEWRYRLKAYASNNSSIYWTKEIDVDYYSSSSSRSSSSSSKSSWFTSRQLEKIRAISDIWSEVITSLERDYPNLRRNSEWQRKSDDFNSDMKEVLRGTRNAQFSNWDDFYSAFIDWFSLTVRLR